MPKGFHTLSAKTSLKKIRKTEWCNVKSWNKRQADDGNKVYTKGTVFYCST